MKKDLLLKKALALIASSLIVLNSAFADYTEGPVNNEYNRTKAAQYIYKYALIPNTFYYDFTNDGGDCTNFVSQVLAAGGMPMTYPVYNPTIKDWYYYNQIWGTGRSATWTNAHCFSYYWIDIENFGFRKAYAYVKHNANDFLDDNTWYGIYTYLEPGDLVQYMSPNNITYHSQAVHRTSFEQGEFKVSVGQHTVNGWRNLRNYISALPEDTIICLIKMKQPSGKDAGYLGSYKGKSVSELDSSEDYLFNLIPTDDDTENEKWSRLSAIKEELVSRAKFGIGIEEQKQPITKDVLISFIGVRVENNNNIKNAIPLRQSIIGKNKDIIHKCEKENKELEIFLNKVMLADDSNKEETISLWNEFWNEVLKQKPPLYYE